MQGAAPHRAAGGIPVYLYEGDEPLVLEEVLSVVAQLLARDEPPLPT